MVRLEFSIALRYQISGPSDFIFNLHAAETGAQRIVSERVDSNVPVVPMICKDPHYGNRLMRMSAAGGELEVRYGATVDIEHYLADRESLDEVAVDRLPSEVLTYLLPSRYCQSDQLSSMSCWEFAHLPKGYARVEAIARWVRQRTRFEPGTSTSGTTALDTLTDRRGVCRDYAHLMIALCRSLNIPARFVTGIDYGADPALGPPDFHAYVEAYLGNRWYLFDPSGISPTTGLLRIGTGRDAADASFATLFGSVRCGMPAVSIRSIVDPGQGIAAPEPTDMAVSTADPVAQSAMLHLVRPNEGMLPPQATRPPAYGRHYA